MENGELGRYLEEKLSYWKAHVGVHDVLASELSYSLIYDNIHPDKVGQALDTVGLTALPNRFFLMQVDDYSNYTSKMRVTQEFFQKTAVLNMVRDYMRARKIEGFGANMIGQEKIICYLCCPQWEGPQAQEKLHNLAERIKEYVRLRSAYTISVCISGQCTRLQDYSKMYPRMNLELSKTYFKGKEFTILLKQVETASAPVPQVDLNACYPELLGAFSRRDDERFGCVLQRILEEALQSHLEPSRAKLEIIRLVQRLGAYCIHCGAPEELILDANEEVMNAILNCAFVADTREYLWTYYRRATAALEEYTTDTERSFKLPVEEYIAAHYGRSIRLADLSEMLGFSEGYFAKMFRRTFGTTFVQFLTEYRIRQSQRLLTETRLPIEQIADRVGINSYSYFCTCFKRVCGMSPGAYRSAYTGEPSAQGESKTKN